MTEFAVETNRVLPGLRDRKKVKRRLEIIEVARKLFAKQGIDATTMADIAEAAGISVPTIFNYFGSKDGVLIALIGDGTREARERDRDLHWQENTDLGTLVLNLFVRVSTRTLEIAGKRVWRYAEAAAIRNPETELASQYSGVTDAMIDVLVEFFDGLDLRLRAGPRPSGRFLAQLFYDVWMPCYVRLITIEQQTLREHEAILRARIRPLVEMLFDDECAAKPRRRRQGTAA